MPLANDRKWKRLVHTATRPTTTDEVVLVSMLCRIEGKAKRLNMSSSKEVYSV